MAAWLRGESAAEPPDPAVSAADGKLEITIEWAAQTPVVVRDSMQGTVVDALPLADRVTRDPGPAQMAWLLPGSSIKGALRSHAERIVRTLRRVAAPGDFLEAVRDRQLGPVLTLFGFAGDRSGPAAGEHRPSGWRGALDVPDCYSRARFSGDAWQRVMTAHSGGGDPEEELMAVRDRLAGLPPAARPRISHHVAIDRWTGGAAENLLFSVLEPAGMQWEDLTLAVDTRRCRDDPLALPLLLLLLRDLHDGWVQLGFGGTRGRGSIAGVRTSFAGTGLPPPWDCLNGRSLQDIVASPPGEVEQAFAAWQSFAATTAVTT